MTRLLPPIEIAEREGTTLLCLSRRDVPICSAWVSCPGGRWLEPPGQTGLAPLCADLMEEGPAGSDPLAWQSRLEAQAISLGISAGPQEWQARWNCLSEDAALAQERLRELLSDPGLPRRRWRQLVRRHRGRARESFAQPWILIRQVAGVQALGLSHPYAGAQHDKMIADLRYEAAAAMAPSAFRRRRGDAACYTGDTRLGRTYAAIAGDVDPAEGMRLLEELAGTLPPSDEPLPAEPKPRPSRAPVWLMDHPKLTQAFLALSRPGVKQGDPDRLALRLAVHLLGGGLTSRLMQRVRVEMGQTYGIHASLSEEPALTPFVIQTFTQLANVREMLLLIERVLGEVAESGFTEEEVQAGREHLHGNLPLRLTDPSAVVGYVSDGLRAGLSAEALEEDWQAILTTPAEAVHAAARRLIGDGSFRLAVVGPAKAVRPQIEGLPLFSRGAGRGQIETFSHRAPPGRWPR